MRKISRFLVSPVVEQKSVITDGETRVQHEVVERPTEMAKSEVEIAQRTDGSEGQTIERPTDINIGVGV